MKSYRIEANYILLSPLSHIGESVGTESFLNTETIIGADGRPTQCFVYNGNAWRGMMRDAGAKYMLDVLGGLQLPLPAFHLLFSGGSLGGDQSIDIDQARQMRATIPHISLFGGGVGNQILGGKLKVGSCYPLCAEAQLILPPQLKNDNAISWRAMTMEQSFTRTDDEKNENLRTMLLQSERQVDLLTGEIGEKKKKDGPSTQMRYTVEALATGTELYQRIDVTDVTDIEFGALVAAIHEWSKHPYMGGMIRLGYGLVAVDYQIVERDGTMRDFINVGKDVLTLSDEAESAKQVYDDHLKIIYTEYLEGNRGELVAMLVAGQK